VEALFWLDFSLLRFFSHRLRAEPLACLLRPMVVAASAEQGPRKRNEGLYKSIGLDQRQLEPIILLNDYLGQR